MTPATFGVGIPSAIGAAITAIYESGAKGVDSAVLVCLVHSMDWKSCAGSTGIPSDSIAERIGASRSTVVDALGRLESSGVLTFPPYENGRPKDRTIRWDVLRTYASPSTRRGGDRTSDGSGNRTGPVIGQGVTEVRSGTCPVIGQGVTEHRSLILMSPPVSPHTSTKNASAPASAVADLFTPPSQPDAATGEATGDTAPPPGSAPPLPADEDAPVDPGKPREPITPAMAQTIDVLAKLNPKAAERMTEGKSETLVRATRKAIRSLGMPALLARLEYAAAAQDDEPMKFWRTTLGRKLAPLLTVDGPWVRGLDEAAAESAERIEDSGGVDLEAEAASAWFDMTQRRGWKTICYPGGAPNRPGDYGKPDRWDLSDTADEHDRRMTAFLRAGSIPKWQMADAQGRIEFRARWIGFYVDEVKA